MLSATFAIREKLIHFVLQQNKTENFDVGILSKGLDEIVKIQNCDLSSVKFCLC